MTVRGELRSYLVDSLNVGERVYAGKAAEGTTFPYVRYVRVSAARTYFHQSYADTAPWVVERFQLDCTDITAEGAEALGDELITVLSGFRGDMGDVHIGDVSVVNDLDRYDPTTKLYRRVIDVIVSHVELSLTSS